MSDQASNLRNIVGSKSHSLSEAQSCVITIANFTGELNGIGITLNLAQALSQLGQTVLVIDMSNDFDRTANIMQISRICGMELLIQGEKRIEEIAKVGLGNVRCIVGGSALFDMCNSSHDFLKKAEEKFISFCSKHDYILISCQSYNVNVQKLLLSCDLGLLLSSVSSDDIVSTFRAFKNIYKGRLELMINCHGNFNHASAVIENFSEILNRRLGLIPNVRGWLGKDEQSCFHESSDDLYIISSTDCSASFEIMAIASSVANDASIKKNGMRSIVNCLRNM